MENLDKNKVYIVITAVLFLVIGLRFYGQTVTKEKVDEVIAENNLGDVIQYESASFNPVSMTPSIQDVIVSLDSENIYFFDEIVIHKNNFDKETGEIDLDLSYSLKSVPLDEAPKSIRLGLVKAAMFGMDKLSGEGSISIQNSDEESELGILINLDGIGVFNFSLEGSYDQELLMPVIDSFKRNGILALMILGEKTAAKGFFLDELSLNVSVENFLKKIIERQNNDETRPRSIRLESIKSRLHQAGLARMKSEQADGIAAELMGFMDSPSGISLSVAPDEPMSIQALMAAFQAKVAYDRLNMTISN